MEIEKTCIICNRLFKRQKGVSNKVWAKRQCCCKNCSNYSRRKDLSTLKHPAFALKRRIDTEQGVDAPYTK